MKKIKDAIESIEKEKDRVLNDIDSERKELQPQYSTKNVEPQYKKEIDKLTADYERYSKSYDEKLNLLNEIVAELEEKKIEDLNEEKIIEQIEEAKAAKEKELSKLLEYKEKYKNDSKTLAEINEEINAKTAEHDKKINDLSSKLDDIKNIKKRLEEKNISIDFDYRDIKEGPVASQGDQVAGEGEPVAGEDEPVAGEDEPVAGEDEPVAGEDEPVAGEEEPVAGEEEPVAGEEEPVAGEEEPVAGEEEPVAGEEEPVASEGEPAVGEDEPEKFDFDKELRKLNNPEENKRKQKNLDAIFGNYVNIVDTPKSKILEEEDEPTQKEIKEKLEKSLERERKRKEKEAETLEGTATSEGEPVVGEEGPVASEGEPVVEEEGPAASEGEPVVEEEGPAASEGEPVVGEEGLATSEGEPVVGEEGPAASEGEPVVGEEGPAASEGEPAVGEEEKLTEDEKKQEYMIETLKGLKKGTVKLSRDEDYAKVMEACDIFKQYGNSTKQNKDYFNRLLRPDLLRMGILEKKDIIMIASSITNRKYRHFNDRDFKNVDKLVRSLKPVDLENMENVLRMYNSLANKEELSAEENTRLASLQKVIPSIRAIAAYSKVKDKMPLTMMQKIKNTFSRRKALPDSSYDELVKLSCANVKNEREDFGRSLGEGVSDPMDAREFEPEEPKRENDEPER